MEKTLEYKNELIDKVLTELRKNDEIQILALMKGIDEEFKKQGNHKFMMEVVDKMAHENLIRVIDNYGLNNVLLSITQEGVSIVDSGGWLKHLEKQKSKEEREDKLLNLRIKTAEEQIKKMKQKFIWLVIGMLISLVGSLAYTYIMTYK